MTGAAGEMILAGAVGAVSGYLLGSIPFALIIGKMAAGVDIRRLGSGNPGATNLWREVGAGAGAVCFVLDFMKGFLPVMIFGRFGTEIALISGVSAVLGHTFSIFLGMKGGKGVATAAGLFFAEVPLAAGIALLSFVVAGPILSGTVSLGSIIAAAVLPAAVLALEGPGEVFVFALLLGSLVIFRHRANISRLLRGEESGIRGLGRSRERGKNMGGDDDGEGG